MGNKKDENKALRRDVAVANKELNEVLEAVELIGGIPLEMDLSFDLGILRKTFNMSKEVYTELNNGLFNDFSVIKKDQAGQDVRVVPAKKAIEFSAKKAILDNKAHVYSLPSFSKSQFVADKDDEDDPRHKVPSGFITRMLPILTDYEGLEVTLPASVTVVEETIEETVEA